MNISKVKLIAMDLDGTLTQHKSKMTLQVKNILDKLSKDYFVVIVGAGSCQRIFKQMGNYPINIIGQYGMQRSSIDKDTGDLIIVKNEVVEINKQDITDKINKLRQVTGYINYDGDTVEFHPSGTVTFPLLGTKADKNIKLAFDPTREKRRKIYHLVKEKFEGFTVFIGGTSSFDIAPSGFNKLSALSEYLNMLKLLPENVVYFGDDYGVGGNDEHVFLSDIEFICIDNYSEFPEKVQPFIK